jgi:hypothetical protein
MVLLFYYFLNLSNLKVDETIYNENLQKLLNDKKKLKKEKKKAKKAKKEKKKNKEKKGEKGEK